MFAEFLCDVRKIAPEGRVGRQFGIAEAAVRSRLWLIFEPPLYSPDNDRPGAAPTTGRVDLKWLGEGGAQRLPAGRWATEFVESMPQEIVDTINAARADRSVTTDTARLRQLAERFGDRWKQVRLRIVDDGVQRATRVSTDRLSVPVSNPQSQGGEGTVEHRPIKRIVPLGKPPGHDEAEAAKGAVSLPDCVCTSDPADTDNWLAS